VVYKLQPPISFMFLIREEDTDGISDILVCISF